MAKKSDTTNQTDNTDNRDTTSLTALPVYPFTFKLGDILLHRPKNRTEIYRKVIPVSFENSGSVVYQEFDISDRTAEMMKAINSVLTFADAGWTRFIRRAFLHPAELMTLTV